MARELIEKIVCDLCKNEALANIDHEKTDIKTIAVYRDTAGDEWLEMSMPVRYTYHMSDGYPSEPYFSMSRVDLCPKCQERLLKHWPIEGDGGLGCKIREWIIHD